MHPRFQRLFKAVIQGLDDIGGVDSAPDVDGVVENGDDVLPVPTPQLSDGRVAVLVCLLKHDERFFRLFLTDRGVDHLKVMGYGFAFAPGHER